VRFVSRKKGGFDFSVVASSKGKEAKELSQKDELLPAMRRF